MGNMIAIKAENVSKYYRLGEINTGTFFRDMQLKRAIRKGVIDKYTTIGANPYTDTKEGFYALQNINFEIEKGQRVGIIGRNGAGKSTLLKVISEITAPTSGWVGVNGRVASLLEVGTGFSPELTGRENVYLNGAILGMKRSEINEKMRDIIEFSEIDEHIDTPVRRYSSGMYVRLAFAVAANLESEILIADEVLAVGDAQFQKKALGKMKDISTGQGRTVLFVSHQMNAVKALCKTGMVIKQGQIAKVGEIDECISFYQKDLLSTTVLEDLSHYNTEFFELLGFRLVDNDGHDIDCAVSNDSTCKVEISLNIKKVHSALNFGYAIYDKEGTLIYWSNNTDVYEENNIHLGENVLLCDVPHHFLNEDTYFVYLMSSIHFQQWLIDPSKNSPHLVLSIQGGLSNSPFWMMRRPGICAPLLKWEYKK